MTKFRREPELIAIALALIGESAELSPVERRIAARYKRRVPSRALLAATKAAITRGEDPLGDALIALRPAAARRKVGAVYTPAIIIDSMLEWAKAEGTPSRVIDAGSGSGRFLIAAGAQFPGAKLVGIEVDPVAALTLRANLAVHDMAARATVIVADYRAAHIKPVTGKTLFIGNPPYVRHHGIGENWKSWYATSTATVPVVWTASGEE
jgi:SAM-dependent methyltransferase